jgi:membrane dipeptidase
MIFDAHGDILTDMYLENKKNNTLDSFRRRHLKKYQEAQIKASIFVNFTEPEIGSHKMFRDIFSIGFKEIAANADILQICTDYKMLKETINSEKISVIVGVEGIKFLKDKEELVELYSLGLRHIALTWNEVNDYGCGLKGGSSGLTARGKAIIEKAEELGMIIDLAHANEKTFFDCLAYTTKPVIVSHANCKSLCDHLRNLTDDQLLAIKARGGVVGFTNVANFIALEAENKNVQYLAKHIDYAIKLIGVDHIGLGFDVCFYLGDSQENTKVNGFEDINLAGNLIDELKILGYSNEDLEKIKYKNFLRVIKQVLK